MSTRRRSLLPMNWEEIMVLNSLAANLGSSKPCVHCLQSVLRQAKEDGLDWQGIYESAAQMHNDRPVPSVGEVDPDRYEVEH